MGPHSFKCGKKGVAETLAEANRASMGPHSFKCGKARFRLLGCLDAWSASMGPHSFKCGKFIESMSKIPGREWLQWGRTLSSAESSRPPGGNRRSGQASMGPHSFKCGKSIRQGKARQVNTGFNGAALFQVRKANPRNLLKDSWL